MKKRIIALLLAVVMLLGYVPVPATATEHTHPTFVVDTVTASAGETVDVTIRLENNPGITSIKLMLEYADGLTLVGVTGNPDLGRNFLVSPGGVYPVILNWYDGLADVTGDWVFATLQFTVADGADAGEYPVTISYNPNDVFDVNEDNVSFEIANGAVEVDSHYGRQQLAGMSNAKALLYAYDRIVAGVEASAEHIEVYNGADPLSVAELQMVMDVYGRDYAHHFWMDNGYSYSSDSSGVVSLMPQYVLSGSELETAKAAFEQKVAGIIEGLTDSMSEYERELYLHDQLAEIITYADGDNAHNAYGALVEGKAVCEGYAEALQYLLQCAGIQSFIALGSSINPTTNSSEDHAWNYVRIDGEYYHVDLTWNDQDENLFHTYFNQTDAVIRENHAVSEVSYTLPACDSVDAQYFTGKDTYLDDYTVAEVGRLLKNNGLTVHVYLPGDVDGFITWYYTNIVDIAIEAGISGGFSYGYTRLGRELILAITTTACDHSELTLQAGADASCTADGYKAYYKCSCGKYFEDSSASVEIADLAAWKAGAGKIPASHDLTEVPATEATCDKDGNVAYFTCDCGKWFWDAEAKQGIADKNSVVIKALSHSFNNYVSDNNATCAQDGTETAKCDYCEETDTRVISGSREDAAHTFPVEYTSDGNADCTTDGTKSRVCTTCGEKETVTDEGSALGHRYENGICTACGIADLDFSNGWVYVPISKNENSTHIAYKIENGVLKFHDFGDPSADDYGRMPDYTNTTNPETKYDLTPWYQLRSKVTEVVFDETISYVGSYTLTNMDGITEINIQNPQASVAKNMCLFSTTLREEPLTIYAASTIETTDYWIRGNGNRPITQAIENVTLYFTDMDHLVPQFKALEDALKSSDDVDPLLLWQALRVLAEVPNEQYVISDYRCAVPGAEDVLALLTELSTGTCGENLTYRLTAMEQEGKLNLNISGSGEMTQYDDPTQAPWYGVMDCISDITVGDLVVGLNEKILPKDATYHVHLNSEAYAIAEEKGYPVQIDTLRVLLIGNSHTSDYSEFISNILKDLKNAGLETEIQITRTIIGSTGLYSGRISKTDPIYVSHLEYLQNNAGAYSNLKNYRYDLVIVQDYMESIIDTPAVFADGLGSIIGKIKSIAAENGKGEPQVAWFADWVDIRTTGGDNSLYDGEGNKLKLPVRTREAVYAHSLSNIAHVESLITQGVENMPDFVIRSVTIKENAMSSYLGNTKLWDKPAYCLLEIDTTHMTRELGRYLMGAGVMAELVEHYRSVLTMTDPAMTVADALTLENGPVASGTGCQYEGSMNEELLAIVREAISNPEAFHQSVYVKDPVDEIVEQIAGMKWNLENVAGRDSVAAALTAQISAAYDQKLDALTVEISDYTNADNFTAVVTVTYGYSRAECKVEFHTHSYKTVVTAPTCTEQGYTTYTCECGDSYVDSKVDALGHKLGNWETVKDATCTEDGSKRRDCDRCNYFETEVIEATGHKYESVVTAPTCTEEGYTTHTCHCGDSYVDSKVDALGHDWDAGVVTKEPTETETGLRLYNCTRCDETKTVTIPTLDHVHKYEAVVTAPTCTAQGYTTHTCRCGDSYVDSKVDALGHEYGEWTEVKAPTCDTEGKDKRICDTCGDVQYRDTRISGDPNKILVSNPVAEDYYAGKTVLLIGDSITAGVGTTKTYGEYLAESLGVTVINKGTSGSGYCSGGAMATNKHLTEANVSKADVITIMLGVNDWNWAVKDGSWNGKPGYYDESQTYYQLGNFNSTDTSTFYGALHAWCQKILAMQQMEGFEDKQFVVITPLITSWNVSVGKKDWNQDKLNIHGHVFREYCTAIMEVCAYYDIPVFDANMYSGIYYRSAEDNNVAEAGGDGVHVNAAGHALLAKSLEEFLLEGYTYENRTVADCGHRYETVITQPTCTEDGYTTHKCPVCHYSYTDNYVDALGHKYETVVTAPTCTKAGYTTNTCAVCGDNDVNGYVPALGHKLGDWETAKDATCTEDGSQRRDCDRCDYFETETIEATGHKYESVVTAPTCTEEGYTTHTCHCGDSYVDSKVDALGHDWDAGVVTKEPTETETGLRLYNCTRCDETKTVTIPTLDHVHKYEAVVTAPTCTAQGYTTHTCHCGDSYVDTYVPATGHTNVDVPAIKANSARPGMTEGVKCGVCGEILEAQQVIPAKGYDWMIEDGVFKILLIGNSYSEDASSCGSGMKESQLLNILQSMLGDDVEIVVGLAYSGGKGLNWHATQADQGNATHGLRVISTGSQWASKGSMVLCDALEWTDWDVVSLQHYNINTTTGEEGLPYPEQTDEKFYKMEVAAEYLLDYVDEYAPQADAYFYTHWAQTSAIALNAAKSNYDKMAAYIPVVMDYVGTESGNRFANLIPVGLSIQNARTTYLAKLAYNTTAYADKNLNLYTDAQIGLQRDGGHVSFNIGRYIAGLTFAETIIPEEMRVAGYVLPEIRVTESVGKLPGEYTQIAQKSVFAAVESWRNGSLAVTNIEGYSEDPIVAAEETLKTMSLTLNCGNAEKQIEMLVLAEVPADFAVETIQLDAEKEMATVAVRFGYSFATVQIPFTQAKHTHTAVVTAPTCTEQGYTTHTCRCGDEYVDTYVDALGHKLGNWETVEAATCTEDGSKHRDCDRCDYSETETIKATGHDYESVVTAPTCTEQGYTTHTCHCGDKYIGTYVAAIGHSFGAWTEVKAPTCTEKGSERRDCANCDHFESRDVAATGHKYEAVVTAPTCTAQGYTTHTCHCGDKYIDTYVAAIGHSFDKWTVVKSPTCTEKGSERRDCANCDHFESRDVAATGHDYKAVVTVPECTKAGFTTNTCHCGDNYVDGYVAALGHAWDAGVVTKEPTETETGTRLHNCNRCDETKTVTIPTLDHVHKYEANVTTPTCTAQGYTTHTCRCGDEYVDTYVDALGHKLGDWETVKVATCTEKGSERRDCANCDHFETREIDALGHKYEAVVTAPTCTEQGYTTHTCHCGESYIDDYQAALAHNWNKGEVTVPPTEETAGERLYTCQNCGETYAEVIQPMGHKHQYITEVFKPTCTETGYTAYICELCGFRVVENYVKELGHSEVIQEAVAPTCTEDGLTEGRYCETCGEVFAEQTVIGALGHELTGWVVEEMATCTGYGLRRMSCNRCDYYEAEEIQPTGHNFKSFETKPTCLEQGYTTYTCHCGESYVGGYVSALGHDLGRWTLVSQPTPDQEGQEKRNCTRCDHFETRAVAYKGNALVLTGEDLTKQKEVWIEGMPYPVITAGDTKYVELPTQKDCILVTYTYQNAENPDVHTQYPTGMKVYKVSGGKISHIKELDNLLQYSGSSIRITGKKGIRMITSITKANKTALTGKGLAGYKLVEYGTALCWASEIKEGDALTLGKPFTRSNYAYKKGVADPIFATTKDLVQYTNVLVGFTNDQCKDDIAMRPYIILEDANGQKVTLYGGTIYRSIGYIAYQNRNVVKKGTEAYKYVWDIIHHVYGTKYDADYKG